MTNANFRGVPYELIVDAVSSDGKAVSSDAVSSGSNPSLEPLDMRGVAAKARAMKRYLDHISKKLKKKGGWGCFCLNN